MTKTSRSANKIIGSNGENMKRIINKWVETGKKVLPNIKFNNKDIAKLRLRGKGSKYLEGPKNQESNEPLHLCVSSKYKETYQRAWELTENLIIQVYEQYYKFLADKKMEVKKLRIKKSENSSTRKNSGSSNCSKYSKSIHQNNDFYGKSKHNSDSKKPYQQHRLISPEYINNFAVLDRKTLGASGYSHPKSISNSGAVKASHDIQTNFGGPNLASEVLNPKLGGKSSRLGGLSRADFS